MSLISSYSFNKLSSQLKEKLKIYKLKFEDNRSFGYDKINIYIKNGFFSRIAVVFLDEFSKQDINKIKELHRSVPMRFRRKVLVILHDVSDYWADVAALLVKRKPTYSFFILNRKIIIGKIPKKVYAALISSISTPSFESVSLYPPPKVAYSPESIDESLLLKWIRHIQSYFQKYALAAGFGAFEPRVHDAVKFYSIGEQSFIFVSDITEELVFKVKEIIEQKDVPSKVSIVGATAGMAALELGGNGLTIYALHQKYAWRSGLRRDRSILFEDFLSHIANINLVNCRLEKKSLVCKTWPFFLIAILILLIGLLHLHGSIHIFTFTFVSMISICMGWFFVRLFKVSRREYTLSIIYGGLTGIGIAVLADLISILFIRDVVEVSFRLLRAVLWTDLAILSAVIYTVFTTNQPRFVSALPRGYINKHIGTDSELIRKIINSWDRGWSRTIPNMGDLINLQKAYCLYGYILKVDTLFERRVVTEDECSASSARYRNINEARLVLAPAIQEISLAKWSYLFKFSPRFDRFSASMSFKERGETCTCPSCGGTGKVTCSSCGGSGTVTCSDCGGSGRITEYETESFNEYYTDYEGKPQTRTVYRTVDKQKTCFSCGGSGRRTCSSCGGSGEVTCSRCLGSGCIMIFPLLNCTRRPYRLKACVDPTTDLCLKKVVYKASDKKIIETPIQDNILPKSNVYKEIPKEAAHLMDLKLDEIERMQSEDLHIIRQRLRLGELPITEVNYGYKNKNYRLWVFGLNNLVHAEKAPVNTKRLILTCSIIILLALINVAAFFISDVFGI